MNFTNMQRRCRMLRGNKLLPDTTGMELLIELSYSVGYSDTKYLYQPFAKKIYPHSRLIEFTYYNEHFAAFLGLVLNIFIIVVFLRVLGLLRMASKMIVNIAFSGVVFCVAILSSSYRGVDSELSKADCRNFFVYGLFTWILHWKAVTSAVLERFFALNTPRYYTVTFDIIGPFLLCVPWLYLITLLIVTFFLHFFQYDISGCSHHLLFVPIRPQEEVLQIVAYTVMCLTVLMLYMSRFLHSTHADNSFEINRIRMEMKTSAIIGQIAVLTILIWMPLELVEVGSRYKDRRAYSDVLSINVWFQLAVYQGVIPFLILLTRREFRQACIIVFSSKESIRRRRHAYMVLAMSDRFRRRSAVIKIASDIMASKKVLMSSVKARDEGKHIREAPDWLRQKSKTIAGSPTLVTSPRGAGSTPTLFLLSLRLFGSGFVITHF